MNKFKLGDKVLYDGEVHTVIQVPVDGLTWKDVGYLDKDCVVLDLHYDNAINYTEIELYKTAHKKLIELGFEEIPRYNKRYYVLDNDEGQYIEIYINTRDVYYYVPNNERINLELSKILTQYLEELESESK